MPIRPFFTASKKNPVDAADNCHVDGSASNVVDENVVEDQPSDEVKLKVKELDEKIADLEAKILLADQDEEQASKRYFQQREDVMKYSHSKFAKESLQVADNLKRIASSVSKDKMDADPDLKRLIEAVHKAQSNLVEFYKKHGIVEIDPVGKPFNPNQHEAMFEIPLPHQQTGTVAHVIQSGYMIHERVLRPARVGVVRN